MQWCVEGVYLWNTSVNDTCGYRVLTSVLVFLLCPPAANIQTCWDPCKNHFAKKRESERTWWVVCIHAGIRARTICMPLEIFVLSQSACQSCSTSQDDKHLPPALSSTRKLFFYPDKGCINNWICSQTAAQKIMKSVNETSHESSNLSKGWELDIASESRV